MSFRLVSALFAESPRHWLYASAASSCYFLFPDIFVWESLRLWCLIPFPDKIVREPFISTFPDKFVHESLMDPLRGAKKPLRACYCSGMLFFRFKKAPAGTLLLINYMFRFTKKNCGHVTAQKYYFQVQKAPASMLLLRNAIFEVRKSPCGHATAQECYF